MIECVRVDERLSVGKKHPAEDDLRRLAQNGFKSVVNLRTSGEANQPLLRSRRAASCAASGCNICITQ